ncbi:hypothetical protein FDP41_007614 [Naegleria fowleri]|uniref:BTB domain-containing protein n=1 Tax=Naegleria fowleri TaxID=5763 RepID=A0A6A5CEF6_NAEFO|nr:uncharacterized protein FDP41_007614 [Naegleria fowleri]KAF0983699.1 hypothetical protein FDP41_007614 [Naegleria fowleri]
MSTTTYSEIKSQLESVTTQLLSIQEGIDNRMKELKKLEDDLNLKFKLMEENAKKARDVIKLDVGGKIFKTSKETLLSRKDTFFYAMISSGKWLPDEEGCYFIDRNPKMFPYILDYLRYGKLDVHQLTTQQKAILAEEADYYLIPELATKTETVVDDCFDETLLGPYPFRLSKNKN